jgi:hypothetical protein
MIDADQGRKNPRAERNDNNRSKLPLNNTRYSER